MSSVSKDSAASSAWKADDFEEVKTRSAACEYDLVEVEELNAAEQEIIRHVQKESFKEEISKSKETEHKGRS